MNAFSAFFDTHGIVLTISWVALGLSVGLVVLVWIFARVGHLGGISALEVSEAEIGIGKQKLTIRPNYADIQIAYKLWVEVSTRKIGLPIDLDHDVIAEVYDSWYSFFQVTRELIKDIPANKVRGAKSTEQLVNIAIEVLNEGLRPHLTTWQARFRRWYDRVLQHDEAAERAPQDVQKGYAEYDALVKDLLEVNQRLINYRAILRRIALQK
jgi:hypothetical protein